MQDFLFKKRFIKIFNKKTFNPQKMSILRQYYEASSIFYPNDKERIRKTVRELFKNTRIVNTRFFLKELIGKELIYSSLIPLISFKTQIPSEYLIIPYNIRLMLKMRFYFPILFEYFRGVSGLFSRDAYIFPFHKFLPEGYIPPKRRIFLYNNPPREGKQLNLYSKGFMKTAAGHEAIHYLEDKEKLDSRELLSWIYSLPVIIEASKYNKELKKIANRKMIKEEEIKHFIEEYNDFSMLYNIPRFDEKLFLFSKYFINPINKQERLRFIRILKRHLYKNKGKINLKQLKRELNIDYKNKIILEHHF